MQNIDVSIKKLINYIEEEKYKGYDPYDSLNSPLFTIIKNAKLQFVFTQIQKRNAFNIRPLIGVKKEYNPKGVALMLSAFCKLYETYKSKHYYQIAQDLFDILMSLESKGYSGAAWGYNFAWSSQAFYVKRYNPCVVVTAFVVRALFDYYKISKSLLAKEKIISAATFVLQDLPFNTLPQGKCIGYTQNDNNCCYNASLFGAEIIATANHINNNFKDLELIIQLIDTVVKFQNTDGSWYYSYNIVKNKEKKQIDFHQGFVIDSISYLLALTNIDKNKYSDVIEKGLNFYYNNQFLKTGQSIWRLPKEYPVDIHNQAQGIITFTKHKEYNTNYLSFANTIAEWTIENMQDNKKGYFYYKINRLGKNKISFMRWSQAWMLLALSTLNKENVEI